MNEIPRIAALGSCLIAGFLGCGHSNSATEAKKPAAQTSDADYARAIKAAQAYIASGRIEKALAAAQSASASRPQEPLPQILWGRALAMNQDLKGSAEHYEMARKLGSRDRDMFLELASVYDVSKNYDAALDVYGDALKDFAADPEILQEYALTLMTQKRFDEAIPALASAVKAVPSNMQLRQDFGLALLRAGAAEEASSQLTMVVSQDPNNLEAMSFLAQAKLALGADGDARKLLDQILAQNPRDEVTLKMRARLLHMQGAPNEALADLDTVLKLKPQDPGARLTKVGVLVVLKRYAEAQTLLEALRSELGEIPDVKFRSAQLAYAQKKPAALQDLYGAALLMPNNLEAWRSVHRAAKAGSDRKLELESTQQLVKLGSKPD